MSREESFRVALRESGIEYSGPIYIDGKLHRIRADGDQSNNSWYVLYSGSPVAGAYGCWKRDLKGTWCERNGNLTQPEWQDVRQRWQEANEKLKAETVTRQKKARKVAAWILNRSRPALTLHRYLFRKRVKVFGNLRVYRRSLVLPLRDLTGELQSLQFIAGDGAKNFLRGGRIAGCFFALADKVEGPLVTCEGYATGASIYEAIGHAVFCAMNSGNLLEVAKAVRERWPQREIIIAADNDQFTEGNPGLTKATAAARAIRAKLAVPQFRNLTNKPTDFNDLATAEGLDAVREQVGSAEVPREFESENLPQKGNVTGEETIVRLAALSLLEYERCRKEEAEKLGCREAVLDKLVEEKRPKTRENNGLQGNAVQLMEVEPWDAAVDGAEVLDEIAKTFACYVVLTEAAAYVCSLWCALAHIFYLFLCSPRLNVRSAERNCGKTTLRDVVSLFVPRPVLTENFTVAVLFRLVNARAPVILADEYDTWLKDNEEMRGLLNAGHRRGAMVYRCEGDANEVRAFSAHAPAMLCGIGALPGTLHDRSIVIHLERAKQGELQARFDEQRTEKERELARKLARWCADKRERFANADPELPPGVFNRLADNWRPLFAIAEAAGGDWPKRCVDAFAQLTMRDSNDSESMRTLLLDDIRKTIAGEWPLQSEDEDPIPIERIFSKTLVEQLCAMAERPWPEARRGKPISEQWLAKQLANFRIHPKTLRIGEERAKGYETGQFSNAFARYLPQTGDSSRDTVTYEGKRTFSIRDKTENVTDAKTACTEGMSRCHACKAGESENEAVEAVSDDPR